MVYFIYWFHKYFLSAFSATHWGYDREKNGHLTFLPGASSLTDGWQTLTEIIGFTVIMILWGMKQVFWRQHMPRGTDIVSIVGDMMGGWLYDGEEVTSLGGWGRTLQTWPQKKNCCESFQMGESFLGWEEEQKRVHPRLHRALILAWAKGRISLRRHGGEEILNQRRQRDGPGWAVFREKGIAGFSWVYVENSVSRLEMDGDWNMEGATYLS